MVIRDVIHGDINIDEKLIQDLIETPEFQRLRQVRQLGLTYIAFPTAEHSRFMHSVGVYYLARRMLEVLDKRADIRISKKERQALLVACLLHDIGHGAFSHTSEDFFLFNHEDFSKKIILDEMTQINQILNQEDPSLPEEVVRFIDKKHPHPVLNKILSGTVDVDRMDYLLRDSYYCGVSYGEVDIDRIFNVIDVVDDKLVFHIKGLKTIEDFVLCRYNMFSQVYLNKKALAYEELIKLMLNEISRLVLEDKFNYPIDISPLLPFLTKQITVKDYLSLDDFEFLRIINTIAKLEVDEQNHKLVNYARVFINKKLRFKPVDKDVEIRKTPLIEKKIYNESINIYTGEKIVCLEDISALTNFLKEDYRIKLEPQEFYILDLLS